MQPFLANNFISAETQSDENRIGYVAQRNRSIAFWIALNFIPVVGQIATYLLYQNATKKLQEAIAKQDIPLAVEAFKEGASRSLEDYVFQDETPNSSEVYIKLQQSWFQYKPGPVGWNKGVLAALIALTLPTLGMCWFYTAYQMTRLWEGIDTQNVHKIKDALSRGAKNTLEAKDLIHFAKNFDAKTKEALRGIFKLNYDYPYYGFDNYGETPQYFSNNSEVRALLPLIQYENMLDALYHSTHKAEPDDYLAYIECWHDHSEAMNAFFRKCDFADISHLIDYVKKGYDPQNIKLSPENFIKVLKQQAKLDGNCSKLKISDDEMKMMQKWTSSWSVKEKTTTLSQLIQNKSNPNYWVIIDPEKTVSMNEKSFLSILRDYDNFAWEDTSYFKKEYLTPKAMKTILLSCQDRDKKMEHFFELYVEAQGPLSRDLLRVMCENLQEATLGNIYEKHKSFFTKEEVEALFEFALRSNRSEFASAIISETSDVLFNGQVNQNLFKKMCDVLGFEKLKEIYNLYHNQFSTEQLTTLFKFAIENQRVPFILHMVESTQDQKDLVALGKVACKYEPAPKLIMAFQEKGMTSKELFAAGVSYSNQTALNIGVKSPA